MNVLKSLEHCFTTIWKFTFDAVEILLRTMENDVSYTKAVWKSNWKVWRPKKILTIEKEHSYNSCSLITASGLLVSVLPTMTLIKLSESTSRPAAGWGKLIETPIPSTRLGLQMSLIPCRGGDRPMRVVCGGPPMKPLADWRTKGAASKSETRSRLITFLPPEPWKWAIFSISLDYIPKIVLPNVIILRLLPLLLEERFLEENFLSCVVWHFLALPSVG